MFFGWLQLLRYLTSTEYTKLFVKYLLLYQFNMILFRCGRTGRAGNKGYAWTFLTPEQGRYAGDVLRAYELAGANPPPELRALWERYKLAQEKDGKKVHTGGGFSGKGKLTFTKYVRTFCRLKYWIVSWFKSCVPLMLKDEYRLLVFEGFTMLIA